MTSKALFRGRIRRMWGLRKTIKYLDRYAHSGLSGGSWYHEDEVNREGLIDHLSGEKHFREDWRDTLSRWWPRKRFSGQIIQPAVDRMHKQRKELRGYLEDCIKRGFLELKDGNLQNTHNNFIKITVDGRNFIKWPNFLNAVLKEFSYLGTIVLSVVGTGIIGTVFSNWGSIWGNWIQLLTKIFYE